MNCPYKGRWHGRRRDEDTGVSEAKILPYLRGRYGSISEEDTRLPLADIRAKKKPLNLGGSAACARLRGSEKRSYM
jgi:hypothetical protein